MSITQRREWRRYQRFLAGAAATLALGGSLAACGSSGTTTSATANGAAAATTGERPQGTLPQGAPRGFGTEATGTSAAKAKAAALARYPGTVERVMRLDGGSYVVHVIRGSGSEVHVMVSKAFRVTGVEQGMPGGGAPPANGATPPGSGDAAQAGSPS